MKNKDLEFFDDCLLFGVNSLARSLNKISEFEFERIGLNSSYANLLLLLAKKEDISTGEIAMIMNLDSSTITRFVDKLLLFGYLKREQYGRTSLINITKDGKKIVDQIKEIKKNIDNDFEEILGENFAEKLLKRVSKANKKIVKVLN